MQSTTNNPLYALQDVPGKGKGLVAIEKISKGTRILSEEPIITISRNEPDSEWLRATICQEVDALSKRQRRAFLSMYNIHPYGNVAEQYLGIFRTSALPTGKNGKGASSSNWNENIKRHTVHAIRDIDKGEEITVFYLHVHNNYKARQEALHAGFKFTCICRLCSLPPEQRQESDRRLDKIYQLDDLIGQGGVYGILSSSQRKLRYVEQQIRLYNEQGADDPGLARAFLDAAQIAIANGDLARGRIFAERAVAGWQTSVGDDSTEVIEHRPLIHYPSKHQLYGFSHKWETKIDEAPCGLESSDFEDWLWKRDKPKCPGQVTGLRRRTNFPGFNDLPGKNGFDLDFYESNGIGTERQKRHWCFLGEIVDFSTLVRLGMEIKDINNKNIPLYFYTNGGGEELEPALAKRDTRLRFFTRDVIVFYIIFPLSLQKLLALDDQVQQFSTELDSIRMCHGCGKKAASLKQCGKCSSFWYCNKACQEAGWNEKGHKSDCKLLRDPDLKGLLLLKWDEFDSRIQFPLHVS